IALDDFGTGYSSLTYLHKLPIDILKVDREFIKNIINEDEEAYIFKSIVELAHNLNLKVIAEGVETKEQLAFLIRNGCDIGQGYYFSKPIPASEIKMILENEKK
ncbi:MAG: EAL domain-containing protein, partial [Clostridiaceae bacterium]